MLEIPTRRFSDTMFVLGIIFCVIASLWFLMAFLSSLSYRGPDLNLGLSLVFLLFTIFLMAVGNKKVVDPDYLITFLRDFNKKD